MSLRVAVVEPLVVDIIEVARAIHRCMLKKQTKVLKLWLLQNSKYVPQFGRGRTQLQNGNHKWVQNSEERAACVPCEQVHFFQTH